MDNQITKLEELKLDSQIMLDQHKKYLAFEELRYKNIIGEVKMMIDDKDYRNVV